MNNDDLGVPPFMETTQNFFEWSPRGFLGFCWAWTLAMNIMDFGYMISHDKWWAWKIWKGPNGVLVGPSPWGH